MAAFLETLTLGVGTAVVKAVAKIWIGNVPMATAVSDSLADSLKTQISDFQTRRNTERLLENLKDEIAQRLAVVVESEFSRASEGDRNAAAGAAADALGSMNLSAAVVGADLDAIKLERFALEHAKPLFVALGDDVTALAELILRESCACIVALAWKLPNFQVSSTRELLRRTTELQVDLTQVLDALVLMRAQTAGWKTAESAGFETRYRRSLVRQLDRLQLFGLRQLGAGGREYPLSVAYVTLSSVIENGSTRGNVHACLSGLRRAIVRGEAGSGKTTLLHWLAVRAASRDFSDSLEGWKERIPFYIRLRDYSNGELPAPERLLESAARNLLGEMPAGWTHQALARGALVLVDGIDELPAARRANFLDWLKGLTREWPEGIYVLTSRPAALDSQVGTLPISDALAGLHFTPVSLEPMSTTDAESLISQWHRAVGRELTRDEDRDRLQDYEQHLLQTLRDRPAVRGFTSNPLLCAMVCFLHWDRNQRLPNDRMELYDLALEMLLERRDIDRGIGVANLDLLDRRSKEGILDDLAYWMLLNAYSEISRDDALDCIRRSLVRITTVEDSAEDVLQKLLERSGVLRQPEYGIVDFLHRTFLEYMAARAAVNAGHIGMLVKRAREESWREPIVFAAGHAKGAVRDRLLGELIKKPLLSLRERPIEACVAAVSCLETVTDSVAPELLKQLKDLARDLFPPRDFAMARLLAPAAALEPNWLVGHRSQNAGSIAACIRTAALVGGERMLEIIESYATCEGEMIEGELLRAWTEFDGDEYREKVIRRSNVLQVLRLQSTPSDDDALRALQILVRKRGAHPMSGLKRELGEFVGARKLDIRYSGYQDQARTDSALQITSQDTTLRDARELVQVRSLVRLTLAAIQPGVLGVLAELPALRALAFRTNDCGELFELAKLPGLESLQISGEVDDFRALNVCPVLKQLDVAHSGLRNLAELPLKRRLLSLAIPAVNSLEGLATLAGLQSLTLRCTGDTMLELSVLHFLPHLRRLRIVATGSENVCLPNMPLLETLTVANARELEFADHDSVYPELKHIRLSNVRELSNAHAMMHIYGLQELELVKTWPANLTASTVRMFQATGRLVKLDAQLQADSPLSQSKGEPPSDSSRST